jgi:hypothetical protein
VFAWKPFDMKGIPREIDEHKLNIKPGSKPVKQQLCHFNDEKCKVLTVYNRIKVQVDLQADKSPVVVKGPFFPRVVNPRYRICGTMHDARVDLVKPRNLDLQEVKPMHLILKNIKMNLIY